MEIAEIEDRIRKAGLTPRGAFRVATGDGVPPLADGAAAETVVLAGNAGHGMWRAFFRSRCDTSEPLDSWSRARLTAVAEGLGATPLFPDQGPPYLPFQRWAMRAEPVHVSPIGILIHPDYGLWHGYRGALAFAEAFDPPPPDRRPSPCESCSDRPCLTSCPVGAFSPDGYDVAACVKHISRPEGSGCMDHGCRARRACPIGRDYHYEPPQARFHMEAFRRANSGRRGGTR